MSQPARLAIGTVQPQANRFPLLWGLQNVWRRHGIQVQPFRAHAELSSSPGAEVATGRPYRHLDTGMLFPRLCNHLVQLGARGCDLAVVDGDFSQRHDESFATLCDQLDFAAVVILDVSRLEGGHLPVRPREVDAVLLDAPPNSAAAWRWWLEVETLWNVPVLGWMPQVMPLRAIAESLSPTVRPSHQLCHELGSVLLPHCRDEALLEIAHRTRMRKLEPHLPRPASGSVTIAVGLDEAMSRHFPENLELLQARGARLIDFSPLRSAELPRGVDMVYLSDGCLRPFVESTIPRSCLFAALRAHVASGGCIYGEGLGAALLAREVMLPDGQRLAMAGVVPWSYRLSRPQAPALLRSLTAQEGNWLTQGCGRLRGYEGCMALEAVHPAGNTGAAIGSWRTAVASTVPLFFPAHPRLVANMLHLPRQVRQAAYCP